jgi:spoIIIJ-associated protein
LEVTLGDDKEADALLGRDGDRLEDLQFLVNKLLRQRHPGSARVRLDVNGYRARKDDVFLDEVRRQADLVREGGRAVKLEPMNSYQRRLVHHLFRDDPEVETWAPEDESRMKRITLLPRGGV